MGAASRSECLFCGIADKRVTAHVVHENERLVAFLDIGPIRPGHVQIIPREHFAYFDDLPPDLAAEITQLAQRLAVALKAIYRVERVGFLFTGGDVPHAHAHVVPLVAPTDITSRCYIVEEALTFRDMPRPSDAELVATARAIRAAL